MNRRNFLMLSDTAGSSCLIPAMVARRIRDFCLGNNQPLSLAPARFSFDLHSEECFGRYTPHLGDPNGEPDYPSLREFIGDKGFCPGNRRSLCEYLINWRYHDVATEGLTGVPTCRQMMAAGAAENHWKALQMPDGRTNLRPFYRSDALPPLQPRPPADEGGKGCKRKSLLVVISCNKVVDVHIPDVLLRAFRADGPRDELFRAQLQQ